MQKSVSRVINDKLHGLFQRLSFVEERWYWVNGGVTLLLFEFLNHYQELREDLSYQQLQRVHENILLKCRALVN